MATDLPSPATHPWEALPVEGLEHSSGDNLVHLLLLIRESEHPVAAAIYLLTACVDAEAAEIK